MRVLVTGARDWSDKTVITGVLEKFPPNTVLIQGGAKGADILACQAARELGWTVITVNAEWAKYGRAAGPIRNQQMIDEHQPELVLAFHWNLEVSKGTKDMVNRALKAHIPVLLFGGPNNQLTLL